MSGERVEPRTISSPSRTTRRGWAASVADLRHQRGHGLGDHAVDPLAEGGEVVGRPRGGRHVVEADDRDVVGHAQPKLEAQHVHHREGHVVVADEDGVGRVGAVEHPPRRVLRQRVARSCRRRGRRARCPARVEALAEALLAVALGRGALEAGDVGDALVAERHEHARRARGRRRGCRW